MTKFSSNRLVKRLSVPYLRCDKLFNALAERDTETGAFRLFPRLEVIVFFAGSKPGSFLHMALDMALLNVLELRRELGTPVRELIVAREMECWSVWADVGEGVSVVFFD